MTFTKEKLIEKLKGYKEEKVEQFASYCCKLALEKDKQTGELKNAWITKLDENKLATLFKRVAQDGLFIDGTDITLSSRGISYNYKAYKNMLYIKYPESIIDVQLVYKGDEFSFKKEDGKVHYTHNIVNPFEQSDDKILGGYCVIKNRRGEFLTTMTTADIEKCKKVARTLKIWNDWFKQMALKSIIKSACSLHFYDTFQEILKTDNETENDLELPLNIDIKDREEIDKIASIEALSKFYKEHKDKFEKNGELLKYLQTKQTELKKKIDKK